MDIPFDKLLSVFYTSVLLLLINCVIIFLKWLWFYELQTIGSAVNVDNVMGKFIISKRTEVYKTDVNFFTITIP